MGLLTPKKGGLLDPDTGLEVFIVLISTKSLHPTIKVGAVYTSLTAATKEVDRLNEANSHTKAWWIIRHIGDERK